MLAFGLMCGLLLAWVVLLALVQLRPVERWVAAAQVLVTALTWLVVNRSFEGRVLAVVFPGNGLTLADLLAVPSAVTAALLVLGAQPPTRSRLCRDRRSSRRA